MKIILGAQVRQTGEMKNPFIKFIPCILLLLGLPLAGLLLSGRNIMPYLEFPPKTRFIDHASFSLPFFIGIGLFVFVLTAPFAARAFICRTQPAAEKKTALPFPWWGYTGLITGILSWILAWSRCAWFEPLQLHTFTPLWISYIVVVNALTFRRSGRCMLRDRPGYFLMLFAASAVFWWFFEYLNRFVQNWYYIAVSSFNPVEYFLFASVSFSTVLPAVLGTQQFLDTFPFFTRAFGSFFAVGISRQKELAWCLLLLSGLGLAGLGLAPNLLYPLLWLSPLLMLTATQRLAGEQHLFSTLTTGNWTAPVTAALAGLICGFFWEMWNYYSLAKWMYSLPYVHCCSIFEMPLLGFAGYLPFGMECAVAGSIVGKLYGIACRKRDQLPGGIAQ